MYMPTKTKSISSALYIGDIGYRKEGRKGSDGESGGKSGQ
jgi:hypothetical protein